MSTGAFDTLTIARKLTAAGFSENRAEAVTGVLRDVRDSHLSPLATKADFLATKGDLKAEIADAKFEISKWVLSAIGSKAIVIVGAIVALSNGVH